MRRLSAPRLNYSIDVRSGGLAVEGVQGVAPQAVHAHGAPALREISAKSGVCSRGERAMRGPPTSFVCEYISKVTIHAQANPHPGGAGPQRRSLSHSQVKGQVPLDAITRVKPFSPAPAAPARSRIRGEAPDLDQAVVSGCS